MNKKEKRMFNIAKEVSLMSEFHGPHIGTVVASGKRVISTGFNSSKTRPLQHQYNMYRGFDDYKDSIAMEHSEIAALSHLIGKDIDWSQVHLYIYRELQNGQRACCRPCKACMQLIKDLGIKHIYYIDENGEYCEERVI